MIEYLANIIVDDADRLCREPILELSEPTCSPQAKIDRGQFLAN